MYVQLYQDKILTECRDILGLWYYNNMPLIYSLAKMWARISNKTVCYMILGFGYKTKCPPPPPLILPLMILLRADCTIFDDIDHIETRREALAPHRVNSYFWDWPSPNVKKYFFGQKSVLLAPSPMGVSFPTISGKSSLPLPNNIFHCRSVGRGRG